MDRKFLEELGLEKEVINKILNQNGVEIQTLKTQLGTKETEVKTLRDDLIAANTKIAEYEQVDVDGLKQQLETEKNARVADRKSWALTSLLKSANCKDPDYVIYKLTADKVEPKFDDKGDIQGADEFLADVKTRYAAQFEPDKPKPNGTGSFGNFRREHGEPATKQQELEKINNDTSLPLAQRIAAKNQLFELKED